MWAPCLLVIAFLVAHQIPQEEKMLAEHFGAEFEAYRRTRQVIPYVS
jgi:protein-S-isoprenylcysteine O-methyltransferase Ste14